MLYVVFGRPDALGAAAVVAGTSVVLWGHALGALSRNAMLCELALVTSAYARVHGALVVNILDDPQDTVTSHAPAIPVAALLLGWWPLVQVAG